MLYKIEQPPIGGQGIVMILPVHSYIGLPKPARKRITPIILMICFMGLQPLLHSAKAQPVANAKITWMDIPALTIKAHERPFGVKIQSFEAIGNKGDSSTWQEMLVSAHAIRLGPAELYSLQDISFYKADEVGDVVVRYKGHNAQKEAVEIEFFSGAGLPYSAVTVTTESGKLSMYYIETETFHFLQKDDPFVKASQPLPQDKDAGYIRELRTALPL